MRQAGRWDHWATVGGARRIAGEIAAGWRRTDRAGRRGVLLLLGAGLLVSLLLDAALVVTARRLAAQGALAWEPDAIGWLAMRPGFTFFDAMWVDAFGSSAMVIPALVLAIAWLAHRGQGIEAGLAGASFLGARAMMHTGWALWDRARPELVLDGIAHPPAALHAFPSGHVVQVVSVYGFLLYLGLRRSGSALERSLAWLAFAGFVGIVAAGRLRIGSHWPTDLAGGALLGATWLGFLILATRLATAPPGDPRGRPEGRGHSPDEPRDRPE